SSSSASASERVTVTSTRATLATMWAMRGLARFFWKYDATRFLRLLALPTYSTSSLASMCRYTPGRDGRSARNDLRLKLSGILITGEALQGLPVGRGLARHEAADALLRDRGRLVPQTG